MKKLTIILTLRLHAPVGPSSHWLTPGHSVTPMRPCDYLSTPWMVHLTPGGRYRPLWGPTKLNNGANLPGAGHGISGKKGPRRLPRYPSLISIPELGICLVGKAHVTKMKLILTYFSLLGDQIPQTSYWIFNKSVICIKLITCSAKLYLQYMQLSVLNKFCNIVGMIVFTV